MQNQNLSQFPSRIAIGQYGERQRHMPPQQMPVQPLIVDETKQYIDGLVHDTVDEEFDSDSGEKEEKQGLGDHMGDHHMGDHVRKKSGKKTRGRVKIKMEFIQNKLRRYTTFSKRKTGIMKKAYELSTLTGTQVMLLVASETGHVYTFATRKLQPMITSESGKALIQTCLNSPDPTPTHQQPAALQQPQTITPLSLEISPTQVTLPAACTQRMSQTGYEEPDLQYANGEEEMKTTTSVSGNAVQYNNQQAETFAMASYVSPTGQGNPTKAVSYAVQPMGSITTIFTPAGVANNQNSAVQIQNAQTIAQEQPQILCGQLQLHRIHPQNIILTGNSGVQPNHILLNQVNDGGSSHIVSDSSHVVSTEGHTDNITPPSSQHEVITFVSPEASSGGPLQMLYNSGGVMYASSSRTLKRSDSQVDVVALQHTPVIQKSGLQQDSDLCTAISRTIGEESARLSRNHQNDILK